ncbi:peptidoglycan DD-metalloendopeptidase family protein [Streptomyces sp. SID5785]|uniref:M23 family metallopeptidase n=1 Tax=Streptomyces sp. SID5785 TaxID=2690309 RepID=UPI0013618E53|nr:M23 family metallopeptidase [Streptomyces sp. SID5785]MZD07262.1 peptidoglycan DD-metalloendopeptidase family protein [Streptomyces sp. SID5785]
MSVRKTAMVLYRLLQLTFLAMVVGDFFDGWPLPWAAAFVPLGLALVIGTAMGRTGPRAGAAGREEIVVDPPVRGRWTALNSPADKVPSHGTHAYGQSYAIDIVAEGAPGDRPAFAAVWPLVRRPAAFPAFGATVHAVADATVVHASDWRRDHLSRNSGPALVCLMLVEGAIRELGGAGWIVGNHVVLELGDGGYAMYAHLQRGSLRVRPGDRVRAGQVLARCGNSGNSTEPHVHFQLMDAPDLDAAVGLPFRWRSVGVPAGRETFSVDEELLADSGTPAREERRG